MKRFDELTDEEVLALTPEQVERYKDYECALEAVPLLPPEPGPKPQEPERNRDLKLYEVAGIEVATQEEADRLLEAVGRVTRYKSEHLPGSNYYDTGRVPDREAPAITVGQHYSPEGWERDRQAVTAYRKSLEEWQKADEARSAALKKRTNVTEWIDDRLDSIQNKARRVEQLQAELDRYVGLADGDETMARRFLINAHPDAADLFPPPDVAAEPETEAVTA